MINKWDNMKCKSYPTKSCGAQVDSLMKELDLLDKVLDVKPTKEKPLIEESMRSLK